MKREGLILLFIILFIGIVYLIINTRETKVQESMKQKNTQAPTQSQVTNDKNTMNVPQMTIDVTKKYTATLKTSMGNIVIALNVSDTPITVNNFVTLARKDFYDGTIFHRVIPDFMIQGGDPEGTGMGGPGYKFNDEFTEGQIFNKPGLLAMANSGPNTNGSQFFITVVQTPWLTGKHVIFGEVTKGMDVVNAIVAVPTGNNDKPVKDVIITDVVIAEQ